MGCPRECAASTNGGQGARSSFFREKDLSLFLTLSLNSLVLYLVLLIPAHGSRVLKGRDREAPCECVPRENEIGGRKGELTSKDSLECGTRKRLGQDIYDGLKISPR